MPTSCATKLPGRRRRFPRPAAPQPGSGVDRDCARGIVDERSRARALDQQRRKECRRRLRRRWLQPARPVPRRQLDVTRPAIQPLAQRLASGLPKRTARNSESRRRAAAGGEQCVDGRARQSQPAARCSQRIAPAGVPGHPAHQAEQAAEQNIDGVVAGHGGREAFALGNLPRRGPAIQTTASALSPPRVCTVAAPPASKIPRPAQSSTPSCASHPPPQIQFAARGNTIPASTAADAHPAAEPPAIGSGAPRNHGRHGHRHEFKKQRQLRLREGPIPARAAETGRARANSTACRPGERCGPHRQAASRQNDAPTSANTIAVNRDHAPGCPAAPARRSASGPGRH
jgi:hypothetical protein